MKKITFYLLLVVVIATLLTGCGGKPAEPAAVPTDKPAQTNVKPVEATAVPTESVKAPTDTPAPSGPVLGPDGKPVLFPEGVPVPLPEDLSVYNLTYYGYQTAGMKQFVPDDVFKDKAKYNDSDRENARLALQYLLESMEAQEAAQGEEVNQNVYSWHLLARVYAHRYYDTGSENDLETALSYYDKCREKEYAVSIGDHQALLLAAGRELPEEWK